MLNYQALETIEACTISSQYPAYYSVAVGTKLYVSNNQDHFVSVIDTTSDSVITTIAVGTNPLFSTAVGTKLYVNNQGSDNVSVIDTTSDSVITTIAVGSDPQFSTAVGTKLYVSNNSDHSVSVIDTTSDIEILTITVGAGPEFSTAVGTKLYVNNQVSNNVSVIDTTSDSVITTIAVGTNPQFSTAVGTKLYVNNQGSNNVSVIDTTSDSVITTIAVGSYPLFSTAVGTKLYVNNQGSNNVSVIDTTSDSVITTIAVGSSNYSSTVVGTKMYVINAMSEDISVVDTATDAVIKTIGVGSWPMFSTAVGTKLYVNNSNSIGVSVIDTTTDDLLSACGAGGSPPDPDPSPSGGGWPWNVLHQDPPPPPPPPPAILSLSAFQDLNRDAVRNDNEAGDPFAGLQLTVRGSTADGQDLLETVYLDFSGNASLSLSPSSASGYTVAVDTGSSVLTGFKPTTLTETGGIVLGSNDARSLAFGFRPRNLLGYRPCLTIEGTPDASRTSDSESLLTALRDSSGLPILRAVHLTSPLISRGDFLTLLQRTQCIPLDGAPLAENAFIDLTPTAPHAPILAALLSRGFPLARQTSRGPAADLQAPLTRREALLLLAAALRPSADDTRSLTAALPSDLTAENALSPVFLRLHDLGILPPSFTAILSPGRGLTPREALTLLVRASFTSGKIPVTVADWEDESLHAAAPAPAFLSLLPPLPPHSCLETSPDRSTAIRFSDLLPGDALFDGVTRILTLGTKNADGRTLWLLPATRHPAEFGVSSADVPLKPDDPVSIEETIRSLLVLSCLPLDTAEEVRSGTPRLTGTPESRVSRDRLTDLPRNPTLASRILYRSQDHIRAFDLSLFTYAPDLLLGETKKPHQSFSVAEAADLFASALLGVTVRDGLLTPQEAELKTEPLRLAILTSLLGEGSLTWRDGEPGKATPLTRRMLLDFLAAATIRENPDTLSDPVPLGKLWWERIK
ncbi:MAG: YncE family protein [Candidatus Peribacteraceae bacterium]|nr:YncE family protein [Candidatus Peribacteraceae bacterium]